MRSNVDTTVPWICLYIYRRSPTISYPDAVAKMFGAYFDDDTFKNIATDVIAMYFNNDVDVTATIKELEFRHLNEK